MLGFGLKSKAKKIIREEFFYKVSQKNKSTFNSLCQYGDRQGHNEYSVAIFFIFEMMNLLMENISSYQDYNFFSEDRSRMYIFDRIRGNYNEAESFIRFHSSNLNRIIYQANSPESEINSMMDEINQKLFAEKRSLLNLVLKKNVNWNEEEVESKVAEIHKKDGGNTTQAAALLIAHSQLANELIEEKYEEMLRNLSFEEIVRRIGIDIDDMKFIEAQYDDVVHGRESNLRAKGVLRNKITDYDNKLQNSQEIDFLDQTSQEDDNPFVLPKNERDKLLEKTIPFSLCITFSQVYLMDELKNKNFNITEMEAATLRSFQLFGALDYIAQGEDISTNQLIEPFFSAVKEKPYGIDMDVSGKILNIMSAPTSDIVNIQINGSKLLEKIYELIPKGSEKFSSGIITLGRENASELANLVSESLILKIRDILK
jgi:hypothetical protein